ncbi:MAG: hypothetical protein RIQ79_348 [Verrucomicrobiota bacterium]|jgi:hypothetical protein
MKKPRTLLVVPLLFLVACSKPGPGDAASAPAPEPKRNLSESLGFASENDIFAQKPAGSNPAISPTAGSPVQRTLTSADGRKLEAVLISRTDVAVKVRRVADSAEFSIPLEKLSAADQIFIKQSAIPVTTAR